MASSIGKRTGMPALAHPSTNPECPQPCTLALKWTGDPEQATISLQSSFALDDSDRRVTLTILIDADNLKPDENHVKSMDTIKDPTVLKSIAQGGKPVYKTMSLTTKTVCPIWCSDPPEKVAHLQESDITFQRFVELAESTNISITFDHKWIPKQNHVLLSDIIRHPEYRSAIPVEEGRNHYAHRYSLTRRQAEAPISCGLNDYPPPYKANKVLTKRHRPHDLIAASPPAKRVLSKAFIESPNPEAVSPVFNPCSPTEKATTASTPSPKPAFSLVTHPSIYREDVLGTIVAEMLEGCPDAPCPSPASPHTIRKRTRDVQAGHCSDSCPRSDTALRALLNKRDASRVETLVRRICDDYLHYAEQKRDEQDSVLDEQADLHRVTLEYEANARVTEINTAADEASVKLETATDKAEELCERLQSQLEVFQTSAEKEHRRVINEAESEATEQRKNRHWEIDLRGREIELCEKEREIQRRGKRAARKEAQAAKRIAEAAQKEAQAAQRIAEAARRELHASREG